MKDEVFEFLCTQEAIDSIPKLQWSGWQDKYKESILAFKDEIWNIPVVSNLKPQYFPNDPNLLKFYEALVNRIELCLNVCKDKSNEELKQLLKEKQ